ncbi:MAG: excinuclease ABC subunit UvrC [Spirochaetota bacterium]|nr:excinuclease ABC subunit UvrC [Spirochaetota bacterium]
MKNSPIDLQNKIAALPNEIGVYLMKDKLDGIIYIGKASSLKKRVSSYFRKSDDNPKTAVLVKNIHDIEFIVTDSEVEALILESTLIKSHKPKYNIRLKDDKRYPYIAVTLSEEYPRVIYTRRLIENGDRYFGPYTDSNAARKIVSMMNITFKLKTCKKELPIKKEERPCLNHQMKRCSGVCQGIISRKEYLEIIDNAIRFLDGEIEPVVNNLQRMMTDHSKRMEYESAADIRDMINNIHAVTEKQKVYAPIGMDQDYVCISTQGDEAVMLLFEFRKGVLVGRKISIFENVQYHAPGDIIKSFILEYYQRKEPPSRITASHQSEDRATLEECLTRIACQNVRIFTPTSNNDRAIINMMKKNLDIIVAERESHRERSDKNRGLTEMKEMLSLESLPRVLECFDISNIQGKFAVGSMSRFIDGVPDKSGYRRYRIRAYDSSNDPGMIHEVVGRRLQMLINETLDLPDLIIIDGGKTQLARAYEAANSLEVDIRIISIAKRFEEIYTDISEEPIRLQKGSPALRIIQNIRDEAHRFAIEYHRTLRSKGMRESAFDEIPMIGEKKKNLLLQNLKSLENVKNSSLEELINVPGIGVKTAKIVYNYFHDTE